MLEPIADLIQDHVFKGERIHGDDTPVPHLPEQQCRRTRTARNALGRKAGRFAGSERGGESAAVIYTLIHTAKLNDVDPHAWLADVLARIAEQPAAKLADLLPWNWVRRAHRTRCLSMAAISHVFTIARAAQMLGVDEDKVWDLSDGMDSSDGCLWAIGPGEESTCAFTPYGIENLQQLIEDERKRI